MCATDLLMTNIDHNMCRVWKRRLSLADVVGVLSAFVDRQRRRRSFRRFLERAVVRRASCPDGVSTLGPHLTSCICSPASWARVVSGLPPPCARADPRCVQAKTRRVAVPTRACTWVC